MRAPLNRVSMTVAAAPGAGTIALGAARAGYQTISAAGGTDGAALSYLLRDGDAWEIGVGVWAQGAGTLTRTLQQSSTGALINASASSTVEIILSADDIARLGKLPLSTGYPAGATATLKFDAQYDGGVLYSAQRGTAWTISASTSGAVRGGSTEITVVADGTNAPALTGMVAHSSDSGYVNTLGIVNTLVAWFDGIKTYYAWSQEAAPVAIETQYSPPTFSAAVVAAATPTVVNLTFSGNLSGALPAASAFAVIVAGSAATISSVAANGTTGVNLTLSAAVTSGQSVTVQYTKPGTNPLQNAAGGQTPSFGPSTATNLVSGSFVRLTTVSGLTESGNSTVGYSYTGNGASYPTQYGVATLSIPANTDGRVTFGIYNPSTNYFMFALSTSSLASQDPVTAEYCSVCHSAGATAYYNGSNTAYSYSASASTLYSLSRVSGTVRMQHSNDGGATWITDHTFAATSTAKLYIHAAANTTQAFGPITGTGLT